MKSKLGVLFFLLVCVSCKEQEARRPITASKSYTLASTVEELKKINQLEESKVLQYIENDSTSVYQSSSNGYWYRYVKKINGEGKVPTENTVVEFSYEILSLNNDTIYSKEELGIKEYWVDKEDFIPAIQDGIKKMKIGETVKFAIPSYSAYGLVGDGKKIGINQSIISIVTLINIKENRDNED